MIEYNGDDGELYKKKIILLLIFTFCLTLMSVNSFEEKVDKKDFKTYVIYTMNGNQYLLEIDGYQNCKTLSIGSIDSIYDCWYEMDGLELSMPN